ncbi:unnamed protein product [Blepharisma stoltei]|uniref:AP complex subunit beta n=1 Tax=Blepharisma stoltei TaxID=1481888 RepID=A0AAU9JI06_9CILI|nr:unnamed protein product [Blepharisma stoltei]
MASGQPTPAPPQFFVDSKKGEVNELKTLIKGIMTERDVKKRREAIKKVIAYMTLGVDVSKLFTDMVLISSTNDIVQKKMIYLYLVTYVEANQEQALMAINTFFKDCKSTNPDPKIRGLALRNLCSLRFPGAIEYIQSAVQEGLMDPDPYVKRTAIMGLVKLFRYAKDLEIDPSFINTVYELIRDPDPTVSANAIIALNEVLENEGGIAINRRMVIYLLNRIHQYTEFGQSIIFDVVSKYQPIDDNEKIDILNILEERLKHASSSVVLGCIKVFLNLTKDSPVLLNQVFGRVQAPLVTLFIGAEVAGAYELSYCVLSHIHLLIARGAADVFERDYKNFFCKYDEPTYIKFIKIEILTMIATENNLSDIVNELCAYVTDVNIEMSKQSIKSIALIAMKVEAASIAIIRQLISFLGCGIDYVVTGTLVAMKDLLRKYRDLSDEIISQVASSLEVVSNDEGKAAIIWMIGEFGYEIEDAPYILEGIINSFNPNDNLQVAHALLTSSVKLFLKRPPEMHAALGILMRQIYNECDNPDLHDRAGFYYKLLESNPEMAYEVVNCEKYPISVFYEDEKSQTIDKLCQEFNSLSVIYQKPTKKVKKPMPETNENVDERQIVPYTNNQEDQESDLLNLHEEIESGGFDIQGKDEYFSLQVSPSMSSEEYQNLWMNITEEFKEEKQLLRMATVEQVEELFAENSVNCVASGNQDGVMKFYFYAKEAKGGNPFLIELVMIISNAELSFTLKSQDSSQIQDFLEIFYQILAPLIS